MDWFFAVDMAVYHTAGSNPRIPVVPDVFLSLNAERKSKAMIYGSITRLMLRRLTA
jgi:hypothetical protein